MDHLLHLVEFLAAVEQALRSQVPRCPTPPVHSEVVGATVAGQQKTTGSGGFSSLFSSLPQQTPSSSGLFGSVSISTTKPRPFSSGLFSTVLLRQLSQHLNNWGATLTL
jgi:hypothetical protein